MRVYRNLILYISVSIAILFGCKENPTTNNENNNNYDYPGLTYLSDSPNKSKIHLKMPFTRNGIQLPDGRVYFVGGTAGTDGYDFKVLLPEVYDPSNDTWKTIPNYGWSHSRYAGKLILLPTGNLFYLCGEDVYGHKEFYFHVIFPNNSFISRRYDCPYSSSEIQDADLMDNGKVVMFTKKGNVFFFDINTEKIEKSSLILPRDNGFLTDEYAYGARVTALPGGNAVFTGGLGNSTTHQNYFGYDLKGGRFNLVTARHKHFSTLLPNGKVLLVGGDGPGGVSANTTEIYDPATITSKASTVGPVNAISFSQSFQILDSNRVFCLASPYSTGNSYGNYQIYNIKEDTYTSDNKLKDIFANSFIDGVTVVKLNNGDLLFNGINHSKIDSKSTFILSKNSLK